MPIDGVANYDEKEKEQEDADDDDDGGTFEILHKLILHTFRVPIWIYNHNHTVDIN